MKLTARGSLSAASIYESYNHHCQQQQQQQTGATGNANPLTSLVDSPADANVNTASHEYKVSILCTAVCGSL